MCILQNCFELKFHTIIVSPPTHLYIKISLLSTFTQAIFIFILLGTFDKSNYEPDEEKETQQRILAGVVNVIDAMIRLKIQWNVHICDMLLDECLKAKDLEGVRFVCYVMDEVGLDLQTSSLNVLMQRYAENGDAESAYNLMRIMEGNDNRTIPNKQTYKLLLKAGNKSTKGRYYSQLIFTDMIANKTMDGRCCRCCFCVQSDG